MERRDQRDFISKQKIGSETGDEGEEDCAAESLPGFRRANVRNHFIATNERPDGIRTHVGEFRHHEEDREHKSGRSNFPCSVLSNRRAGGFWER